ncbi:hypothetical protein HRI_004164500 [Hibiscus trionum]|uniref:Uncharacterized protein n=1 Tax=Hibiscus trionum TaxID=183268 RepID=A0A9W7IYN4_HIBTR|nr:hypothetical protein HRI_004164500 [Hibiscus trionum]
MGIEAKPAPPPELLGVLLLLTMPSKFLIHLIKALWDYISRTECHSSGKIYVKAYPGIRWSFDSSVLMEQSLALIIQVCLILLLRRQYI